MEKSCCFFTFEFFSLLGTFVVEVYGVSNGASPVTAKWSQVIELIGQFLVHIIQRKSQVREETKRINIWDKSQTHRNASIGHIEVHV